MQRIDRLVLLAAFVALAVFRLVRYLRAGAAARRRPPAAIPASGGMLTPTADSNVTAQSPLAPEDAPGRYRAALASALVFTAANVLVWLTLFGVPALGGIPVIWRLVAGIFANFYLVQLAGAVGQRVKSRANRSANSPTGSPFL